VYLAKTMIDSTTVFLTGPEDQQRLQEIQANLAPRLDYRAAAEHCQGIIREGHPSPAALHGSKLTRSLRALAANFRFAFAVNRATPPQHIIFSTGETWGLPSGLVEGLTGHRHLHVMYAHRVYSANWRRLIRGLKPLFKVDGWLCYTSAQAQALREVLGPHGAPIAAISQGTDTRFFDPALAAAHQRPPYILSVGNEMRNYPLLFEAARALPIDVVVKASSAWTSNQQANQNFPGNIHAVTQRLSYGQLRDLYAGAQLVVVPLQDTLQAAGLNAIYEALAMKKCVIATYSRGLPDELIHNESGLIVEPTTEALADAILTCINAPDQAQRLAAAGQNMVRNRASMETYVKAVTQFLQSLPARL
jgi:glycosyltransferase involved in cell wall biosynthesis